MPGSAVLGSAGSVLGRIVLGAVGSGAPAELSVGTVVGAADGLVVDAPLSCETATNAGVAVNIPVPLAFATGSALSAALGGSMASSGGDLAVETVTAQQQIAAVDVPIVLLFETTVGGGSGGGVTASAPEAFATAVGARSRVRIRPDGRANVLLPGRYRR